MNNLRRDIHSAFEGIEPPLGGMPERVVETVLADNKRRKKGMTFGARVPLPLVAVFVAVALVAAVLLGTQLMQAWIHGPSPAGQVHLTTLQQLEARPLHLPVYRSSTDCKAGPYTASGDLGSGPVYGRGGGISGGDWGVYYHNIAYADTNVGGPILVRAIDVVRNQPVVFVGPFAAGPAIRTDTVDGQKYGQHLELVLDTGTVSKTPFTHRFHWDFIAGVPYSWSGSTGWQIDGAGFTETFVAC